MLTPLIFSQLRRHFCLFTVIIRRVIFPHDKIWLVDDRDALFSESGDRACFSSGISEHFFPVSYAFKRKSCFSKLLPCSLHVLVDVVVVTFLIFACCCCVRVLVVSILILLLVLGHIISIATDKTKRLNKFFDINNKKIHL